MPASDAAFSVRNGESFSNADPRRFPSCLRSTAGPRVAQRRRAIGVGQAADRPLAHPEQIADPLLQTVARRAAPGRPTRARGSVASTDVGVESSSGPGIGECMTMTLGGERRAQIVRPVERPDDSEKTPGITAGHCPEAFFATAETRGTPDNPEPRRWSPLCRS